MSASAKSPPDHLPDQGGKGNISIPFPEENGCWGCRVNAHRHGWNGEVCRNAATWACGATEDFRKDYCASGTKRCYHIWLFDDHDPYFVIESKGGWLFQEEPTAWNNRVVLLYTSRTEEPHGMTSYKRQRVAGFYVVDYVEPITLGQSTGWRIVPKAWRSLDPVIVDISYYQYERLNRPYLVRFPSSSLRSVIDTWQRHTTSSKDREFIERLRKEYLAQAYREDIELARRLGIPPPEQSWQNFGNPDGFTNNPFGDKLKSLPVPVTVRPRDITRIRKPDPEPKVEDKPHGPAATTSATSPSSPNSPEVQQQHQGSRRSEPPPEQPLVPPLLDERQVNALRQSYPDDVVDALLVGTARPNGLVILRGEPGVGKSLLATSLAPKEKQHVVAVVSTWRGREDLLGYANPMTSKFVPTPFAEFLRTAAAAWEQGDKSPFLVVFEEFNLSPPEYWLSDILVRSQYPIDRPDLRSLMLPGAPPGDGWNGTSDHVELLLSPAIRFVATVNTDHTTRPLSPRVLDRATLVLMDAPISTLLERAGVTHLGAKHLEAINMLVKELRPFGAHFSQRTALALRDGFQVGRKYGWQDWEVIDLVLLTHVLSTVKVYAQDDPEQIEKLDQMEERWEENYQGNLPRCYARLEDWIERLHGGQDVVQA